MELAPTLETGRIRGRSVSRVFEISVVKGRSLKEVILRRRLTPKRKIWALRDVDLDVAPGETFGVVGQNGSGKSTLLKLLAHVFTPSGGTLEVGGRVGSLIEIGAGFHPEFTGSENVYLNGAIHGIGRAYIDEHLDEIIAFAELEEFADVPVKTYSTGMYMRLGFSVAMHINPDILLLDEVMAVGDEAFQQKCYGKIWDFKRRGGTIVFVSHDPSQVERLCDRAILLQEGQVVEEGRPEEVLRAYHRRLAARPPTVSAERVLGTSSASCRIHDVRAVGADGSVRDRFVEGEGFIVEAWLRSETGLTGGQVTIGFRDESGRVLAAETAVGVELPADELQAVRLHLDEPPMREGRFLIDVRVMTHDRDRELAVADRVLELTVFSHEATAEGPIRLGATWELPAPAPAAEPAAEVVER
jgi:ABC-type polysaccharide/polyol phosphate transport system ATPase subunit